jgi:WD40 repeat protein
LAIPEGKHVRVSRLPSGSDVLVPFKADQLAFSPDGSLLVLHSSGGAYEIWDVSKDEHAGTLAPVQQFAHPARIMFTPDGSLLVGTGAGSVARLWRMPSGEPLGAIEFGNPTQDPPPSTLSLAVTRDGKTLVSSHSNGEVRLWQLPTGAPVGLLHRGRVIGQLVMSPVGGLLAGATYDGEVNFWMPRILTAARTPTSRLTLTDAASLRSLADPSSAERPWIELIARLIERRHRHDIAVDAATGPAGTDIALDPEPEEA